MGKPQPARYRTTNWSSHITSLTKRRSLLIWGKKEMEWFALRDGRRGRPDGNRIASVEQQWACPLLW